uniref:AT-HF n=1 Tax=Arundo donax TaxID=35708 RepID=A0A0A9G5P6_ARUDO
MRPLEESNRLITPGITPRPLTGPFSSLESKRSWRPRQMPRKGRSLRMYSRSASAMPVLLRTSMAEPKAPTPGKTRRSAARMSSGLFTSRMSKPRWRMALRKLRTFPAP